MQRPPARFRHERAWRARTPAARKLHHTPARAAAATEGQGRRLPLGLGVRRIERAHHRPSRRGPAIRACASNSRSRASAVRCGRAYTPTASASSIRSGRRRRRSAPRATPPPNPGRCTPARSARARPRRLRLAARALLMTFHREPPSYPVPGPPGCGAAQPARETAGPQLDGRCATDSPQRPDRLAHWRAQWRAEPLETTKPCDVQGFREYRYGDSNPGFRRERAAS